MKIAVILGQNAKVEGLDLNVNLQQFRKQLKDKGYTEVNTVYRSGNHLVTFLTEKVNDLGLIDAKLIKGTKKQREEYAIKTKDVKSKIANFGYCW